MFGGIKPVFSDSEKECMSCRTVFSSSFNSSEPMVKVISCKECESKKDAKKDLSHFADAYDDWPEDVF